MRVVCYYNSDCYLSKLIMILLNEPISSHFIFIRMLESENNYTDKFDLCLTLPHQPFYDYQLLHPIYAHITC
jgi:hypothetical protein